MNEEIDYLKITRQNTANDFTIQEFYKINNNIYSATKTYKTPQVDNEMNRIIFTIDHLSGFYTLQWDAKKNIYTLIKSPNSNNQTPVKIFTDLFEYNSSLIQTIQKYEENEKVILFIEYNVIDTPAYGTIKMMIGQKGYLEEIEFQDSQDAQHTLAIDESYVKKNYQDYNAKDIKQLDSTVNMLYQLDGQSSEAVIKEVKNHF